MGLILKNLQGKIILITSVTIFILISLSFLFEHANYKKTHYDRLIIHMRENSYSIRTSIESAPDTAQIQRILEGFAHMEEEEYATEGGEQDPYEIPPHEIHVVDMDGIIIASTKPAVRGESIEEALNHKEVSLFDVLKGRESYAIEQMEHSGVKVIDLSIPIRKDGVINGALHYVEPQVKLDKLVRDSFLQHAFFALALIISLSLSVNYLIRKMVTKPLGDMSHAIDLIKMKEHGQDIQISSKDDIGLLVMSFNEMSRVLQVREAEISEYTTKLEEMVHERTKKLEESHTKLLQSQKLASLGILTSGVAHEINNPLGGMFNCVQMLQEKGEDREFRTKYLSLINNGLRRIENTVRKLLWMSRQRTEKPEIVNISKSLKEVYAFVEYEVKKHNISYNETVSNGLAVMIDPHDFQQILTNIMQNAVQSMKSGGTLGIKAQRSDSRVILEISDTGEGIEDEDIDKIFDPFYTTKSPGEGTGLGLWVTYEIIKHYEGEISVHSKKGEGTAVSIKF